MHVPYPTGFIRARMLAQLLLLLCPFAVGFSGIVKSRRSGGCATGKGAEHRSADRAGFGSPTRRNDRLLPARRKQTPDHLPDDPRTQPSGRGIPDRHQIPAGCNGRIPRRDGSQTGAHTGFDKLYVRYFSPNLRTRKSSVGADSGRRKVAKSRVRRIAAALTVHPAIRRFGPARCGSMRQSTG